MKVKLEDLLQKRANLNVEMRSLLDTSADGALTAEDQEKYERMEGEYRDLTSRIRMEKEQQERERSLAESESRAVDNFKESEEPASELDAKEYRAALDKYLRKGERGLNADEHRALVVGTGSLGGYLVPGGFRAGLVAALEQESAVRRLATVLTTAQGNEILVPKVTGHGTAQWVAEGAAKPEVDETFAQASLKAFKAAEIIKVSTELLEDSGFDLEGYIASELGRAIGRLEGAAYATGASNSTTTPKGVVTSATVGKTAASATVITADEIIDLVYSVSRPYRSNARFMMSDGVAAIVRKLKANSEYIWAETGNTINGGEPARLLGYPIEIDPNMDASPAANDLVMAFGDFKGYFIRDVNGIRVQRLNELYAATNHVGFLAEHRTDGALIDTSAVKTLKMAAS